MQRRAWAGAVSLAIIALGLATSTYLYVRGVKLSGPGTAYGDVCSLLFNTSCDATLLSSYGRVFGVSLGGWGVIYFGALALLLLFGLFLRKYFLEPALTAMIAVNAAGLGVSAYLTWLFVSGKVPLCPLCLFTHGLNVALLFSVAIYLGKSPPAVLRDLGAGLAYLLGPSGSETPVNVLRTLAFLCVLLSAVVLYLWLLFVGQPRRALPPLSATPVNAASEIARHDEADIPISAADPRIGPADAPIQLVVFSDFECPWCHKNAHVLDELLKQYPNQLSIVFKNFPLGKACNPLVTKEMHAHACELARAGVAAHEQGKFWPFHDALFARDTAPSPKELAQIAKRVGLNVDEFEQAVNSEAAYAKVKQDVDLAVSLDLIRTPSVFLNGRLLSSQGTKQLPQVIEQLLASSPASGPERESAPTE